MHDQSSTANAIPDNANNNIPFPSEDDVDDLDHNDLRIEGLIHRRYKRDSIIQTRTGQDEKNGPRAEALIHPNVLKAWLKRIEVSFYIYILFLLSFICPFCCFVFCTFTLHLISSRCCLFTFIISLHISLYLRAVRLHLHLMYFCLLSLSALPFPKRCFVWLRLIYFVRALVSFFFLFLLNSKFFMETNNFILKQSRTKPKYRMVISVATPVYDRKNFTVRLINFPIVIDISI